MGVLEAKGVGEGIGGGEIVVWGSTGSVWDKEAAHGVSAAGDDDGVGMGARRGTGAGYVRGDGVGTPIAAGGSRRTDGGCAGPRAGAVGGGGRVAVLESGGWIWVWFIAHGGVKGGEGGVEVGIVVLVDVLGVLLLLWGGGCGDVKDVVSVGVVVGRARVGRSLVRGHVGCLDEVGEFVRKVDRLLGVGGVVGLGGEFAERLREKGDVVGHEQLVVAVVVGSGLWGRSVCGGWQLEAILSDERGICHRVRKREKKKKIKSPRSTRPDIFRGLGPAMGIPGTPLSIYHCLFPHILFSLRARPRTNRIRQLSRLPRILPLPVAFPCPYVPAHPPKL